MLRTINKINKNLKFIRTFATTINTENSEQNGNILKYSLCYLNNDKVGFINYELSSILKKNGFDVIIGARKGPAYDKALYDGWIKETNLFEIKETAEKSFIVQHLLSNVTQLKRLDIIAENILWGFSCGALYSLLIVCNIIQ